MPTLESHQSNEFTKLLVMGDSGTGKTGAMASLVKAGYKLRILDFDNGLDVLKAFIMKDSPNKIGNVEFITLRDKFKASPLGPVIDGQPKAFITALRMLDRWKYDDVDLGVPAEWGSDTIVVVDTLTMLSDSVFNWREPLSPRGKSGDYDKRATYYDSQTAIEKVLSYLTSESFRTNVIVNSHIRYVDMADGQKKGFPTSVGSALGPTIPRYFNSVALCETIGGKRTLKTTPTTMIDLKNPKPFAMAKAYPIETGLADFFGVLREHPSEPKITLRRI